MLSITASLLGGAGDDALLDVDHEEGGVGPVGESGHVVLLKLGPPTLLRACHGESVAAQARWVANQSTIARYAWAAASAS